MNIQLSQSHTLLVRQHALGAGIAWEASFSRPQHKQMPGLMAPQGRNRAHLHRIQHRRNGTHVILAQQQPQKPPELLRLPASLAQHIMHLLQGRHENFPELVYDLCLPICAPGIQLPGLFLQATLHLQLLQETEKPLHLVRQGFPVGKTFAQPLQRLCNLSPQSVELLQLCLLLRRQRLFFHLLGEATRVLGPGRKPLLVPDGP